MAKVKFDKSVRYNKVRYPAHVVFDVADKDIPELQKAGAIIMSAPTATASTETVKEPLTQPIQVDTFPTNEELLTYTVEELTQFAKEHDIDLQGRTRKADLFNLIVAARK